LFWTKINNNKVYPKFLFYQLTLIDFTILNVGSAVPSLTVPILNEIDIVLPPLPEQKAIAEVLSSLDDKIDLLHRQNKTLEQMAETLYGGWVFESEFESTIRDIIDVQNGYAFKSKNFQDNGIHRVIKIKNISGGIVDIQVADFVPDSIISNIDKRFVINTGDVLFAMTGAKIGKMGIIPQTEKSLWLNQRVGLFKEKFKGARFLAYLHLKSDFGVDYIENTATGSAQPNISGIGIENCEFPKFDEKLLKVYSEQLDLLFSKVIFNLGQIRTLESLRDTLLPKLMSGEVRIASHG
jgi:type I restriction enzyme S subunit